jgi:ferredoxin
MAYIIAEPCIGTKDTACVDACPVDCIHPKKDEGPFAGAEMLYIDPVECIDCGACVPVCPVSAIFALDDLPADSGRSGALIPIEVGQSFRSKWGAVPAGSGALFG